MEKQSGGSPKLNTELPCDAAILLLGTCPEDLEEVFVRPFL